ncbi:MAG: hypothetical protein U0359_11180 [Byssovorax sp.]
MRFHPFLAFSAIVLGSALGSLHGCSSGPASADTGAGGGSGTGGGSTTCPPVTCVAPSPTQLTTYADVLATLKGGGHARVVLDYAKCSLDNSPGPNALGAMSLDTFEWFGAKVVGNPKEYFAASETKLIRLQSGFVNDYVRIRVFEDGSVDVEVKYVNPQTFAITVDELFKCKISDEKNALGATFFKIGS